MDFNVITIIGRLAADPDLRYTNEGTAVLNFTVACGRPEYLRKGGEADFFPVVFFGKRADAIANYIRKGSKVMVSGRARIRYYETTDGRRNRIFEILGNEIQFLDPKRQEGELVSEPKDDRKENLFGDPFSDFFSFED